ncbi:MAG TPA: S1/P1 nuclease [Thermoanaerobaculia bacterium]|nr:S1/P1 nuclease [Thermoanaerobaculia bacterium]
MRASTLFVFALTITFALPALGWDGTGHEAVAAIAWDNMQPATRTKVTAILGAAQPSDCLYELGSTADARSFFIRAATWPDVVRPKNDTDKRPCTKFHDSDAHFFDHFWSGLSGGTGNNAPKEVKVVLTKPPTTSSIARLSEFRPLVACKTAPCGVSAAVRAHDLAWILHLAGDINQPLHNAARVTTEPTEKHGDHGGNFFLFKQGTVPSNLHSFWDEILDESIPRQQSESEIAYINRVIAKIQTDHPKASLAARLESGDAAAWSSEGFATAERLAYPTTLQRGGTPSENYRNTVFTACDEAIALAGYRLADLLDHLFTLAGTGPGVGPDAPLPKSYRGDRIGEINMQFVALKRSYGNS